jgi:hypothetical protein
MTDRDKYPTVREVLEGKAEFTGRGYNDPETGMYTEPEPDPVIADDSKMIQDIESGLYLPAPKQKQVTVIMFSTGQTLVVSDTYEETVKAMNTTGDSVLKGPIFPDEPVWVKGTHKKNVICITIDYRDLEEIELQQKVREHNKRMTKSQMSGVTHAGTIPFPTNRKRLN